MAIVTRTRTYNTGDNLPANYYNEDLDEIIAGVNSIDDAQIDENAAIEESKIAFNSTGGHDHSGDPGFGKKVLLNKLNVAGFSAGAILKINSTATGIDTEQGLIPPINLDYSGMTATQPLALNSAGDNMETRLLTSADVQIPRSYVFMDYKDLIVESDVGANVFVSSPMLFQGIAACVKTAPVGADLVIEITSTLGVIGSVTIPAGSYTAFATISTAIAEGAYLGMNITQVGSTTAGSYLTVTLTGITTG